MQNRTARTIKAKSYDIKSIEILSEFSWQPLDEQRIYRKHYLFIESKIMNDTIA